MWNGASALKNDNSCALCGEKLILRGKIKKEFSTRNFGTDEKQILKPICKDCSSKFDTK